MPAPLSGTIAWGTPNLATSGGTAVSADYDVIAADVALVYAKPWAQIVMTAGTLVPPVTTDPADNSCALFASSPGAGTATGVTASMHRNSPASGAGSFTFTAASGRITPPSNCPGMYEVSAQAVINTSAGNLVRLNIVVVNNSGTVLAGYAGQWSGGLTTAAGSREIITTPVVQIPFNISSWIGTAAWILIGAQGKTATPSTIGYNDNALGPNSTPPRNFTFCNVKFLGSYGNY